MSTCELVDGMFKPFQNGRRLILRFIGQNKPELARIEFRSSVPSEFFFRHQTK